MVLQISTIENMKQNRNIGGRKVQKEKIYEGMEAGSQAILQFILENDGIILILDAGGSCSGKGYLAKILQERIPLIQGCRPKTVSIVPMDDCFKNIDDPKLPFIDGFPIFDVPKSYHLDEIISYVQDLIDGRSIRYPIYDLDNNKRVVGNIQRINPADVLIIDGLFAISGLEPLCNVLVRNAKVSILKVFIDADASTRLKRRTDRDIKYASEETIREVFMDRINPLHMYYVQPQSITANIIIRNNIEDFD